MSPEGAIQRVNFEPRPGTIDLNTLQACIMEDEYNLRRISKELMRFGPQWLLDIGSYVGGASLLGASLGMRVVAVEPVPENVKAMRRNFSLNPELNERIMICQRAISDHNGVTQAAFGAADDEFKALNQYVCRAYDNVGVDAGGHSNEVQTITIDSLCELYNIGDNAVMKIDCEGAEWCALAATSPENFAKFRYIVGEIHAVDGKWKIEDLLALCPDFEDVSELFGCPKQTEDARMVGFAFRRLA